MKNKNKSKKVQNYVNEVNKQQAQAGKNKETVALFLSSLTVSMLIQG